VRSPGGFPGLPFPLIRQLCPISHPGGTWTVTSPWSVCS